MPQKKGRKGRKTAKKKSSTHQRVYDFLDARRGEEFHSKEVARVLRDSSLSSVRRALQRLVNDEESPVQVKHLGRDAFFYIPDEQRIDDFVSELESEVSDIVQQHPTRIPKFHNIHIYIKRENCDKTNAPPSGKCSTFFTPMHPSSPYQKWPEKLTTPIRGGIMEKMPYKSCIVSFEIYGTGKMNITVNTTETPMTMEEYLFFEEWLDAMLYARTGYTFEEMRDFATVCWEWSDDVFTERIDRSGKLAITVKMFDDLVTRIYTKHFRDGSIALRTEQAINQEVSYPDWLRETTVMMAGGVNSQYLIRQNFENQKNMERMLKHLESRDNNIEFNQKMISKIGLETEEMKDNIKILAKGLGINLKREKKKKERREELS